MSISAQTVDPAQLCVPPQAVTFRSKEVKLEPVTSGPDKPAIAPRVTNGRAAFGSCAGPPVPIMHAHCRCGCRALARQRAHLRPAPVAAAGLESLFRQAPARCGFAAMILRRAGASHLARVQRRASGPVHAMAGTRFAHGKKPCYIRLPPAVDGEAAVIVLRAQRDLKRITGKVHAFVPVKFHRPERSCAPRRSTGVPKHAPARVR